MSYAEVVKKMGNLTTVSIVRYRCVERKHCSS